LTKKIYLSPPHLSGEEENFVKDALDSNWVAPLGYHVDELEKEICRYTGAGGALALNSGTAGVHLALRLAGVGEGDVVLCSSLTFIASVNPVRYMGGKPVFVDSEPQSWNMDPGALERALHHLNKEGIFPKAAVVVNIYGQSADMDIINDICGNYGVTVIEDAAESLGATYRGRSSGTLGKYGVYSFNGNKIITTSGGGALVSNDNAAMDKARFWSAQAREPEIYYQHEEVGYNYRMSNILAAIGRAQLKYLEDRVERRREIYSKYYRELSGLPAITFMPEADYGLSTRWLSVIYLEEQGGVEPSRLISALEERGIESRPVWKPMHLQPLYSGCKYFTYRPGFSFSDKVFKRGLCLPSGSSLTEKEQDKVIDTIKSNFNM